MCLELSSTYSLRMQPVTKPSWCFLNTPGMSSPLAFSTEFSLCVVLSVTGLGSLTYFCVSYKLWYSCHLYARLILPTFLKRLAPTPRISHLPSMPYFSPLLSSPPNIHMIFVVVVVILVIVWLSCTAELWGPWRQGLGHSSLLHSWCL